MSLKILLADDNITAQRMGSKILTDAGYEVITVSNGAAAIKKIASDKPALLILDVYMPGYTGLEVCEKVKNDPATAQTPVILTVTNMEPFNPQDGNRVRSDGLMIKPFEATDLVAVVQKFEGKSAKTPEHVPTQKIAAVEDFKDASYEEWKAEAPEEEVPAKMELSAETAAAPALGFDEPFAASAPAPAPVQQPAAFAVHAPVEHATPSFHIDSTPTFGVEHAHAPVLESSPAVDLAPATEPLAEAVAPPAEFEPTAVQVGEIAATEAPELEVQVSSGDTVVAQDPALVTNPDEFSQFTTHVGQDHPENDDLTVGVAMPGLTAADDLPTAEISVIEEPAVESDFPPPAPDLGYVQTVKMPVFVEPAPVAEAVEERRPRTTAELDMQQAVSAGTFAAAVAPALKTDAAPEPVMEHPAATPPTIPEHLVAQFAAELEQVNQEREAAGDIAAEPQMGEAQITESLTAATPELAASQLDEERIAAAVNRALEKYKEGLRAELIQAIVRELKG